MHSSSLPPQNYINSLNLNIRGMGNSATLAINERSNRLRSEGRDVYKFGLGQSPFPVPESVQQALRENAGQKDYLPVMGLAELRREVAAYHSRKDGVEFSEDDILIGPGSKELMFITQLVYYGELIIPLPSWVSYAPQAKIVGKNISWVPASPESGFRITAGDLHNACRDDPDRPRLLILNYPNNPSGLTYSESELEEIAGVAREFQILVISDEIYSELHHRGEHKSIASFYPEHTIISSGLSKWCGAGGWRLGTFAIPPRLQLLRKAMGAVASETFTSTSAPIQYAAIRAFEGGADIERYLDLSRRILSALGNHISSELRAVGSDVFDPQGGFYLLPGFENFRRVLKEKLNITTSNALCDRILEDTGVAFLPGSCFGFSPEALYGRLAYVNFNGEAALRGAASAAQLGNDFLSEFCPRSLKATELLCDWFRSL